MKYVYPAIFTEENGQYLVSAPDLSGCHTFGDTLFEAIEMIRDAMSLWLCIAEDNKETIPTASDKLISDTGFVSYIDVDTIAYRKQTNNKSVKKTLSVPAWLNTIAEKENINFSNVLQNALIDVLKINK